MHWYMQPEWWLCILGALTLPVVIWQSWVTLKSADAATKAADAALLNAQAVINAERGKLLFEVEKRLDDTFRGVGVFTVFAVNHGRVPAEILGYTPHTETIINSPEELIVPPPYKPEVVPAQRFLAPGAKCFVAEVSPAAPGQNTIQALNLAELSGVPSALKLG